VLSPRWRIAHKAVREPLTTRLFSRQTSRVGSLFRPQKEGAEFRYERLFDLPVGADTCQWGRINVPIPVGMQKEVY
jgi:hypothetical protein